jgi:hypothetical protein
MRVKRLGQFRILRARRKSCQAKSVPEGPGDGSLARSAWNTVTNANRPVGYGMIQVSKGVHLSWLMADRAANSYRPYGTVPLS